MILLNDPEGIEQELRLSNNPEFLTGLVPVPRVRKPKVVARPGQSKPPIVSSERKPRTTAWNPANGILDRLKETSNEECWRVGYEINRRLDALEPLHLHAYRAFINDPKRRWYFKGAECAESVATGPERTISTHMASWLPAKYLVRCESGSQPSAGSAARPGSSVTLDSVSPSFQGSTSSATTGRMRRERRIFSRRTNRSSRLSSSVATKRDRDRPTID